MRNIPIWNQKHFLVEMMESFITQRENRYYHATLQLAHKDCNWKWVQSDVDLLGDYGTNVDGLNDWSWYEVVTDPNTNPDWIVKHHRECLDVQGLRGEHETIIMRQLEAGNKNIRTISYGEESLISRPIDAIESMVDQIAKLLETFRSCKNCGYGEAKRTGKCSRCAEEKIRYANA